jgi:glycosyltransferase involved in cell wall biosynthesis
MKAARADWDIVAILPRGSAPDLLGFLNEIGVRYELIDVRLDAGPAPTISRKLQRHWRRIHSEAVSVRHLMRYDLRSAVLHLEANPWQTWFYITTLLVRGANVFITMHNALPRHSRWREFLWKANMSYLALWPRFHLFTSNQDTKNKIGDWVPRSFWKNIRVTYTSINPEEIELARELATDRNELRDQYHIGADSFVVLSVGQFIDRKGRWVLLEAAKTVLQRAPDVRFVWLSPTVPSPEDSVAIESYGLGDAFRLILSSSVGSKRQDILRFFSIADMFALPSFVEGLPISLLEAMAMGIPSISTAVYAIPEAIKDHETGILIEPGDADALAERILELKNDQALRDRLAHAGRSYVLQSFDERVAAGIAIDAYSQCLSHER